MLNINPYCIILRNIVHLLTIDWVLYLDIHMQRTCNGLAVFWPTMDLAEI